MQTCITQNADYVGFTSQHLHQRVEEHKLSVIGNHVRKQHGNKPCEIAKNFRALKVFDCLIFEMFFIQDLKPKLKKQSDSILLSCLLNTSNSFHSFHLLFTLHFRILLFLLFVILNFYLHPTVSEIVYIWRIFIHEL